MRQLRCAVALAAFTVLAQAQPQCSTWSVRGTWVGTAQGTMMMTLPGANQATPVPIALLSVIKVDGNGNFTGNVVGSVGGEVSEGVGAGKWTVNADCSISGETYLTPAGMPGPLPVSELTKAVLMDNGNVIKSLTLRGIMGKPVGTMTWRRMFNAGTAETTCSSDSMRGSYFYTMDGLLLTTLPGTEGPMAVPVSIAGAGVPTSTGGFPGTISMAGDLSDYEFFGTGGSINSDCTGTLTWRMRPKGTTALVAGSGVDRIVLLNGGDEVISLTTQGVLGKAVVLSWYKRLAPVPIAPKW